MTTYDSEDSLALNRATATEAVTNALRDMILSGRIQSGVTLRQDELTKQLGVSRTPLREALHRLAVEGLIRLDNHKGAIVAQPSIADVREIYELLEILESRASRKAVEKSRSLDLVELRITIDNLVKAASLSQRNKGNFEFHTALYQNSGKPLLVEIIALLRNRASLFSNLMARPEEISKRAQDQHVEMTNALEAGDADRLEKLVKGHLSEAMAWAVSMVEENKSNISV